MQFHRICLIGTMHFREIRAYFYACDNYIGLNAGRIKKVRNKDSSGDGNSS